MLRLLPSSNLIVNFFTLGHQCIESETNFATLCGNIYNGVTEAGQCFYLTKNRITWDNAWSECAQIGNGEATLTQIQSSYDDDAIINYLKVILLKTTQTTKSTSES